jgi:hypothetical protein
MISSVLLAARALATFQQSSKLPPSLCLIPILVVSLRIPTLRPSLAWNLGDFRMVLKRSLVACSGLMMMWV